jgi:hypothetical protein
MMSLGDWVLSASTSQHLRAGLMNAAAFAAPTNPFPPVGERPTIPHNFGNTIPCCGWYLPLRSA